MRWIPSSTCKSTGLSTYALMHCSQRREWMMVWMKVRYNQYFRILVLYRVLYDTRGWIQLHTSHIRTHWHSNDQTFWEYHKYSEYIRLVSGTFIARYMILWSLSIYYSSIVSIKRYTVLLLRYSAWSSSPKLLMSHDYGIYGEKGSIKLTII